MTRYEALVQLCMLHGVYVTRLGIAKSDRSISRQLRMQITDELQRNSKALQKAINTMSRLPAPRDKSL